MRHWNTPIYAFFRPTPAIEHIDGWHAHGIPSDTPNATPEHHLSIFAVEPRTCVAEPGEGDWLILNQMMKPAFGWGETEMDVVVLQLLNQGKYGLDGFIHQD